MLMENKTFGDRLKIALGDETPYALSKRTGITESLIRKYISGASLPNIERAAEIAKAVGVSLDWLATGFVPDIKLPSCPDVDKDFMTKPKIQYSTETLYHFKCSCGQWWTIGDFKMQEITCPCCGNKAMPERIEE